jgi:hypothetical protein
MNTIQVVIEDDSLESREREAYEQTPDDPAEFAAWDEVVAWPEK